MYTATGVDARRTILQGFLTLSEARFKKRIRANRRSLNADRLVGSCISSPLGCGGKP